MPRGEADTVGRRRNKHSSVRAIIFTLVRADRGGRRSGSTFGAARCVLWFGPVDKILSW
jgi:hypothetical protein